jgi:hypothetical protein
MNESQGGRSKKIAKTIYSTHSDVVIIITSAWTRKMYLSLSTETRVNVEYYVVVYICAIIMVKLLMLSYQ